jgi:hypothetical protein
LVISSIEVCACLRFFCLIVFGWKFDKKSIPFPVAKDYKKIPLIVSNKIAA